MSSPAHELITTREPVATLRTYFRNARQGDVSAIAQSLRVNGQYRPIVVNRGTFTGRASEVLAGNHTLKAAREEGWEEIAVCWVDVDDDQAARIVAADNRTADLGGYDEQALIELLSGLPDLEGTGFTDADLAALVDAAPDMIAEDDENIVDDAEADQFLRYDEATVIDAAVQHWRAVGFPYRHVTIPHGLQQINRLASSSDKSLIGTVLAYQLCDTYHPHRFAVRCDVKRSPEDAFESDKYLRAAIKLVLDNGGQLTDSALLGALSRVQYTQAASNFRPGFALHLYRRFAPAGAHVLDTSTGFGGRLVAFLASDCDRYIGIDPNKLTHDANLKLAVDMQAADAIELINLPAEDVPHDFVAGRCDFAFTSPPYFAKEQYSDDDTQSWKRYSTGESWRDGFLRPMLDLQFAALKSGSTNVVNIADVEFKGVEYPLLKWTIEQAGAAGFDVQEVERFPMPRVPGAGELEERFEPVVVMRRP